MSQSRKRVAQKNLYFFKHRLDSRILEKQKKRGAQFETIGKASNEVGVQRRFVGPHQHVVFGSASFWQSLLPVLHTEVDSLCVSSVMQDGATAATFTRWI